MIIYQNTIKQLNHLFSTDPFAVIEGIENSLKNKLGQYVSAGEWKSWATTLRKVVKDINDSIDYDLDILLEYTIPWTSGRIDVMVVGKNGDKKKAVLIELKGWGHASVSQNKKINPGTTYSINTHPAFEAQKYRDDLYNLSNMESELNFEIYPCVSMPNYDENERYKLWGSIFDYENNGIKHFDKRNKSELGYFIANIIKTRLSDVELLELDNLKRKTINPLMTIKDLSKLKLSANQEIVTGNIVNEISNNNGKKLILVSGAPGCGKTVVAIRTLLELNAIQIIADIIAPGAEFRQSIKNTWSDSIWSPQLVGLSIIPKEWENKQRDVIIFDEAHKMTKMGAKIDQVLNLAFKYTDVVVAFIDDYQVIRKDGMTSDMYKEYLSDNNIPFSEHTLTDSFRNGGDVTFPNWVRSWLYDESISHEGFFIKQNNFVNNQYELNVFKDEKTFVDEYFIQETKFNTRLMSMWFLHPDHMIKIDDNLQIEKNIIIGGKRFMWNINKTWVLKWKANNYGNLPKYVLDISKQSFNDKTYGLNDSIGYYHNVQGAEFDKAFILIPDFIKWDPDKNEIIIDIEKYFLDDEFAGATDGNALWSLKGKRGIDLETRKEKNIQFIKNRLYVLLTRGVSSANIFCRDKNLNDYLMSKNIKKSN